MKLPVKGKMPRKPIGQTYQGSAGMPSSPSSGKLAKKQRSAISTGTMAGVFNKGKR